jgi:hypothetical protein
MTDEAVEFLQDRLSNGERVLSREIKREADDAGISPKALRSARLRLGIKPKAEGFGRDRGSYWQLPTDVPSPQISALPENRADMDSEGTNGGHALIKPAHREGF